MLDITNPSWWAGIAGTVGAGAAALFGAPLGTEVRTVIIGAGALVMAVFVLAHNVRLAAEAKASAVIGGAQNAHNVAALTAAHTAAALVANGTTPIVAASPTMGGARGVASPPVVPR